MPLTPSQRSALTKKISHKDITGVISFLDKQSTDHAGTVKAADKRFVIKEIFKKFLTEKEHFDTGKKLSLMNSSNAKQIAASVIWKAYEFKKDDVKKILFRLADDENWETREWAASAFIKLISIYDDLYEYLLERATNGTGNINEQRVIVLASMGIPRTKEGLKKKFRILKPFLYSPAVYIKRNLGPFALGSHLGHVFPEELKEQLKKWAVIKDENVRWNIAMAFNSNYGTRHPEMAVEVLSLLKNDKSKMVQRAVNSALNSLRKKHPGTKFEI